MRKFLLAFFLFCASSTFASHIVGGEFELIHIAGNTYRLNVIVYFDILNGNPGARDEFITAAIFRKSDNGRMNTITIPFQTYNRVEYFQPDCSNGEVVTDRLIYSTTIVLNPSQYNDQEGYYIAWERCCRNYFIDNIKSVNVTANPGTPDYAGQTFYLEFPAVVDENGQPFVNSSPQLFPPLNDYACPFRPYWVDFAGTDVDGDSLVYSLARPLNTQSAVAVVQDEVGNYLGANPGPYPYVKWEDGYSLDNIMGGAPDLQISNEGFLTVTPQTQGLYVFAVLCEEYRDGRKIGEVRRDFQMLVVDQCPAADPPVIQATGYPNSESIEVFFSNAVTDEDRCVEVTISDLDASKISDSFREEVWIKAVGLNFDDEEAEVIIPDDFQSTLTNGSSTSFNICFPECPFIDPSLSDSFELAIVAFDDACALPLTDSLHMKVFIEPPTNTKPYFANSKGGGKYNFITRRVQPSAGGSLSLNINAWDNENQDITMNIIPIDFTPSNAGMTIQQPNKSPGNAQSLFSWNFDCNDPNLDFNEGKELISNGNLAREFEIMYTIEDVDDCQFSRQDTLLMNLIIEFPGQTKPTIYMENSTLDSIRINATLNETLNFNILAQDEDNDHIAMTAIPLGFTFEDFGISFSNVQGAGVPGISSTFDWPIECRNSNIESYKPYQVYFLVEDFDDCELQNQDSLLIEFVVTPDTNTKPEVSLKSLNNELELIDNQIRANYLQDIEVEITGIDFDSDSVFLFLLTDISNDDNIEFEESKGKTVTRSTLNWNLDCQYLDDNFGPGSYTFEFQVMDDHCPIIDADTVVLNVIVEDLEVNVTDFDPVNIFTPNGDGVNEFFAMEGLHETTNELIDRGLPSDNCKSNFDYIVIVNRWGREVFRSEQRDFKWYGEGEASGVYFYNIFYTDKEFKGTVTLLR